MPISDVRDHVREFYIDTGFFTSDEVKALEFIWNYPFSFVSLQDSIADDYSAIEGDTFSAGFFTRNISGEIDVSGLVQNIVTIESLNKIFSDYNSAISRLNSKIGDSENLDDYSFDSGITEIIDTIIDIRSMSFIEAQGGFLKALGISYLEVFDRVPLSLQFGKELSEVAIPQIRTGKVAFEALSQTLDLSTFSGNLAGYLIDINRFTEDMEFIISEIPNLISIIETQTSVFLSGDVSNIDWFETTTTLLDLISKLDYLDAAQFAGPVQDLKDAYDFISSASTYRSLSAENSQNGQNILDFMEGYSVWQAAFKFLDGVRDLIDIFDPTLGSQVSDYVDVVVSGVELIVQNAYRDKYDAFNAEENVVNQLFFEYEKLAQAYYNLDVDLLSEIGTTSLDSDGPLQSVSGQFLNADDDIAGTVNLSAPTFMADGDVEYTVSLSGIGQGLQYNIAFIIDVSGSMGGQRIIDARNAYIELTNQLKTLGIADVANFAVIPFNSGSTLFADLSADEAIARISSLGAGGGTSFGPALSNAQTFFSSANTGQTNIAYFLSDGQGSGASDFLTNIANVQAFGIGSGANLSSLNIIDSDNAISLTSSSQLVDVLTGSGASVDEIDGIAISVDGNVVDFITPDQLVDGPLGLQYTDTISGLDVSPDAQNEVTATVFLKDVDGAKGSTTLSIASAFGDTTVTQNGDEAQVVLGAFDTSYNADDGSTSSVNLLANNLDNEIIATNTGGAFSLYDGNDYFLSSQTAGSTIDRVIDGGDGYDIVEYLQNYAEGFVEQLSGFIRVGFNSDTLSNVEEIRFADTILITETFQLIPRTTVALIEGTADRDNLVGTDDDEILDGKGGNDVFTGNGGADTFKVTGQFPTILDFAVGEDRLDLTEIGVQGIGEVNFRATANGLKVDDEVSGSVIYLKSVTSDALPEDSFVFAATEDLTVVADDTGQSIFGRAGNDTLISGAGRDRMTGNEGDDTFVMNGTAFDIVTDFGLGSDLLDVSAWGITAFDELRLIERPSADLIEVVGNGHRARLMTDETNLQLVDLDQSDFIFA